jgi:hypothetical protein
MVIHTCFEYLICLQTYVANVLFGCFKSRSEVYTCCNGTPPSPCPRTPLTLRHAVVVVTSSSGVQPPGTTELRGWWRGCWKWKEYEPLRGGSPGILNGRHGGGRASGMKARIGGAGSCALKWAARRPSRRSGAIKSNSKILSFLEPRRYLLVDKT